MVYHLKVAHMAASDVLAARVWWFAIQQQGKIGPIGTKPWKPTREWAQVTAQLSNQAICTEGCKEICQGGCTNWFGFEAMRTSPEELTCLEKGSGLMAWHFL